jgi:MOSC domain-containing protein YiiM
MMMAILQSIQVGMPREITQEKRPNVWTSGIFKTPVHGPVWLGKLNLVGDGQADLMVHGGENKAVLGYSADHYSHWQANLPEIEWQAGAFGENFTIAGLDETKVCLKDIWMVGGAIVQVTQPRQPCWKLAAKLERKDLPKRVIQTGYSGWYFRVVQEGYVEAGQTFELLERRHHMHTIAAMNEGMYARA